MRSLSRASLCSFHLLLLTIVCCHLCSINCNTAEPKARDPSQSCSLYEQIGANDLSLNDVVVEDKESNIICIRARFSLAIKVQEPLDDGGGGLSDEQQNSGNEGRLAARDDSQVVDLGYLQLDSIKSIENTCPEMTNSGGADGTPAAAGGGDDGSQSYPDELKMIVTFECGKLTFNFKKEDNYYLSSIKGKVILGNNSSIEAEFVSEQPMFFTSDLTHHFRFNDLIEVSSSVETEKLKLTANFYNTEIEAFRKTNSRSFVRQADEKSRPFAAVAAAAS